MLLVVFVTLVISILGLFTQVLSLQTARIYSAQVGLMQTMSLWHGTAVNLVRNNPPTNMGVATGCKLEATAAAPVVPTCLYAAAPLLVSSQLPPGYNTGLYTFYSIAFQSGAPAVAYVITFVNPAAADASGDLYLPDTSNVTPVGYTIYDLQKQFARAAGPNVAWGSVRSSGVLSTVSKSNGATASSYSYTIPASPTVPVGSLALISVAQ